MASVQASAAMVEAVAGARRRDQLRFRGIFFATWLILVGLIVGGLAAAGKIDLEFLGRHQAFILGGIPVTIIVAASSIAIAVVFAIIGALGRLSSNPAIYGLASFYVSLVRGTPLLVQILFVYLALPQIWIDFARVPLIVLGIFALAFNYGAYMTEIFRAGIQAIPRGQIEAAAALGMTDRLTMRRIILPQAIRIVIPAIGNFFVSIFKDSALVSVITMRDLMFSGQLLASATFKHFEIFTLVAVIYFLISYPTAKLVDYVEARLDIYRKRPEPKPMRA